ncbi:carbohydrate-selective porin, OprB family [Geobacter sp. OR-1]|uniref:carbohydrate porin n=1 Tax=Geobacter sp. OR-1 TaxID=1266765 RepID=UPI0005419B41|nr:carbohydrate porin [Geobacter sp. OR-1]GAM09730.1 carbohydrate-selective porin, OprB family [Geobacter sp. OR-1]
MKSVMCRMLFLHVCVLLIFVLAPSAFALHPAAKIPDKVYSSHQSCRVMLDIAKKYKLEGVFSKEFEEGKLCLVRMDLAASLHLMEEKLAEKVVKEGAESVSRDDLSSLAEIEDELRTEMLMVRTRTFQARNEGLGTALYPLTKNISISGSMVGAFQNTIGNRQQKDGGDAVGRGDLVFNFRITDSTIAVINIRAEGGKGIDSRIANLGGLNGIATADGDNVRFYKAFVEQSLFDDRLIATIGKISITDYFDNNTAANDETSQFLATPFINAPAVSFPYNGPGARIHAKLGDTLTFGIGYTSSSATGDNITSNGFGIAELDAKIKVGELQGNYRVYGAVDGAKPDNTLKLQNRNAYNAGISIDQQLTEKLIVFGRFAQREKNVYTASRSWSAGVQYAGPIPGRSDDIFAVAYGQIAGSGGFLSAQEKLVETYYSIKLHEKINMVPIFQYIMQPAGSRGADNVAVLGIRSQVTF